MQGLPEPVPELSPHEAVDDEVHGTVQDDQEPAGIAEIFMLQL